MKTFKTILITFLAVATLIGCKKDDDNDNTFLLSNSNFAGMYDLTLFNGEIETTTEFKGVPITAVTTIVGDTFQVIFDVNDNGTLTVDGQYRVTTSVTVAGQTETDTEIVDIDNDSGTYVVNANAQTISFADLDGVDTTFDVTLFNENEVRLVSTETTTSPDSSTVTTLEIRLVRI
ncbi:hypothetical protein G5B37_10985 [Rasiella rasia]|uniref:Lipocalin-like domain-containing protein n=1 Tax=Rasiella rasia TaxID=2744027 RepID=A0A6G6GNE9_9FLAO|nr:hypothetical protein [Rasiella rasia]QIE60068.1 hypothetical protein G5B37_10985 [Rasiella rasia]